MNAWYINNGIKNLPDWYQNSHTSQILTLGGYDNMREALYICLIIWVNTIPLPYWYQVILPRYEGSCMVYISKSHQNQKTCSNSYMPVVSRKIKFSLLKPDWNNKTGHTSTTLVCTWSQSQLWKSNTEKVGLVKVTQEIKLTSWAADNCSVLCMFYSCDMPTWYLRPSL